MTSRTKSEFTSRCRIAAKTNFLLLFPASLAHARYSSQMIDRFLNWGDHGKPKSGKIKGRCQPPLLPSLSINYVGMSKDMEKRLPQLHYIKMKISYDLGFIAIGVAMAT